MTDHADSIELTLVPVNGTDRAVLDRLTCSLEHELRRLRIESVQRRHRGTPAGEHSARRVDTREFVVRGLLSGSGVREMVALVQSWLRRHDQDSVILRLGTESVEITGSPTRKAHQLLKDFYRRHGEG
ncbi:hypothetical protein CDG81_06550 [Actinopolyspora erythraea]|uniref:Uncharacterized protein n=1 Tax=Actinopolyspora erythraea TaxID=414996 RepID=A0A099D1U3_9ACTN|nr:hypothetical protein [Actinopolyspora erythraea]ASU78026.1 hypothetical protein CDG81_06550 [Actinopolyspora erythraea]KGI79792.1 hypothetical protein IL38_21585 [Actinopolyspora erythraea]